MKLTKQQLRDLHELQRVLAAKRMAVERAWEDLMPRLREAVRGVNDHIEAYNATAMDANAFARTLAEDFRDTYDDKTEGWQESDAGQAACAFVETWEEVAWSEVEPVRLLEPDPLVFDGPKEPPPEESE